VTVDREAAKPQSSPITVIAKADIEKENRSHMDRQEHMDHQEQDDDQSVDTGDTPLRAWASRAFWQVEVFAYMVLGILLALTAMLGIVSGGISLWRAVLEHGDANSLVFTIDRLLFVLMVVEILHTVRVSFRSGTLVCEPFLIVGLIASIRRVLVITLESSQVSQPNNWTAQSQQLFNSTMLELGVLGGLILVMVISIYMLRRSGSPGK
jgi:hypothetical protein